MFEIELFVGIKMDLLFITYNGSCAIKPNQMLLLRALVTFMPLPRVLVAFMPLPRVLVAFMPLLKVLIVRKCILFQL